MVSLTHRTPETELYLVNCPHFSFVSCDFFKTLLLEGVGLKNFVSFSRCHFPPAPFRLPRLLFVFDEEIPPNFLLFTFLGSPVLTRMKL